MEKLIELLNEYEIEREGKIEGFKKDRIPYYEWSNEEFGDDTITYLWLKKEDYKGEELIGNSANAVLSSKHYGFIKWLVESEKIDLGSRNPLIIYEYKNDGEKQRPYSFYEEMLIRLAISNSPIDDLISYLK